MGKRSNFERRDRDFYPTPAEAVMPLIKHLPKGTRYVEPCAGNGALVHHLSQYGINCVAAYDIEPAPRDECFDIRTELHHCVQTLDAFDIFLTADIFDCYITNPPWDRAILHPLIEHLSDQLPTWLLFDADWMHTKQSAVYLNRIRKIVSVGRVKWIPDSKMTGKDNCCWYLFDRPHEDGIRFYGRTG